MLHPCSPTLYKDSAAPLQVITDGVCHKTSFTNNHGKQMYQSYITATHCKVSISVSSDGVVLFRSYDLSLQGGVQ